MEALSQAADANLFVESRAFLSIGTFLSVKTGVYLNVSIILKPKCSRGILLTKLVTASELIEWFGSIYFANASLVARMDSNTNKIIFYTDIPDK